jgi:hypothetical protein
MIIALAGRRIDAPDAKKSRFPLQNTQIVKARVRTIFENLAASTLVCSAACGADLIALAEAGSLGLARKVVLPFDRERFRETSVVNRLGDWGKLYDQIIDHVEAAGDLIVLSQSKEGAYSPTNYRILDEAITLSHRTQKPVTAVLVWDGASRGGDDLTSAFADEARIRGLPVIEVNTD